MNLAVWISTALIVIGAVYIGPVVSFKCYKCGYQYGMQGTDTCTQVISSTGVIDCSLPKSCITQMSFDLKLRLVKGVIRGCLKLANKSCTRDTCYDKCEKDHCNNREAKIACDKNACQNGATCLENNGDYICKCVEGYTGIHCETNIDECHLNPCKNNGTCVDKVNDYECRCHRKYVGKNCQTRGVICYTCSYVWTADTKNTRECVDDPDNVKQGAKAIVCPHPRYCTTIRRFDYILPNSKPGVKGDIRSFVRMCDTINRGNYCVEEVNFRRQTCYSTCQSNKCNAVNGDDDPKELKGNTTTQFLDWPELFNYNAELAGSTTTVSYVLVGLLAVIAVLSTWQ